MKKAKIKIYKWQINVTVSKVRRKKGTYFRPKYLFNGAVKDWLVFRFKYTEFYHKLMKWYRGYGFFTGTSKPPTDFFYYLNAYRRHLI